MNLASLNKKLGINSKPKSDFYYVEITPAHGRTPEMREITSDITEFSSQLWIRTDASESVAVEQLTVAQGQFKVEYLYSSTSKKDNLERACYVLTPLK